MLTRTKKPYDSFVLTSKDTKQNLKLVVDSNIFCFTDNKKRKEKSQTNQYWVKIEIKEDAIVLFYY